MNWISVKDRLPPTQKKVIAFYRNSHGRVRRVMAEYVAPRTVLAEDYYDPDCELDGLTDYDEEQDQEWVKESWHEMIDNWGDFNGVHICEGEVTHWMPLPDPPEKHEDDYRAVFLLADDAEAIRSEVYEPEDGEEEPVNPQNGMMGRINGFTFIESDNQ